VPFERPSLGDDTEKGLRSPPLRVVEEGILEDHPDGLEPYLLGIGPRKRGKPTLQVADEGAEPPPDELPLDLASLTQGEGMGQAGDEPLARPFLAGAAVCTATGWAGHGCLPTRGRVVLSREARLPAFRRLAGNPPLTDGGLVPSPADRPRSRS
jgi:hypothetical protein